MDKKRTYSAILLAVILPAIILSSFHRHPTYHEDHVCAACVGHEPHSGHLATDSGVSECLVCNFLGTSYIQPLCMAGLVVAACMILPARLAEIATVSKPTESKLSRAPPILFCI